MCATGLNFKDVLLALGKDVATTRTIGLEWAGVVVRNRPLLLLRAPMHAASAYRFAFLLSGEPATAVIRENRQTYQDAFEMILRRYPQWAAAK